MWTWFYLWKYDEIDTMRAGITLGEPWQSWPLDENDMNSTKPTYPICKLTPNMLWDFRRDVLGGKSAIPPHHELPKTLTECTAGVQADHYAQALYIHASTQLSTEQLLNEGTNLLLAVPCPETVPVGHSAELRRKAVQRVLLDHGIA